MVLHNGPPSTPQKCATGQAATALAADIAHRCDGAHRDKDGWRARCPVHGGESATSLAITPVSDMVLLHCFGGCTVDEVLQALNLQMADLFCQARMNGNGSIVATYDYYDAKGLLLFQVVRRAPKKFFQRRPHPENPGEWISKLDGITPILYGLPQLLAAVAAGQTIFIPEGEKHCDALHRLGLAATTNPMGAGKWHARYNACLKGATVVILPDNDAPGQKHAHAVATKLTGVAASVHVLRLPGLPPKGDIIDWLEAGHTKEELLALVATAGHFEPQHHTNGTNHTAQDAPQEAEDWEADVSRTNGGEAKETYGNFLLGLRHLAPWATQCWYDVVRELPMCGAEAFSDAMVGHAAETLERRMGIPVRSLKLVQAALVQHCRQTLRDPLQEWLDALPPWDGVERLTHWLKNHAGAPDGDYTTDISRLLPVSMVARARNPGCQYRNVIIFEGPEDIGKSKLVKALAGSWYRELSQGMDGKEAHMILHGVWLAEFAELASLGKTADARLKSFITMETDDYIPKFANGPVSRRRRTIFVGTKNPEGDGGYLGGQTGNTRFLPLPVTIINAGAVVAIREQLLAEALVYYENHPDDWWQLSSTGGKTAVDEREARRQSSVYEDALSTWLPTQKLPAIPWETIAKRFLGLDIKDWADRARQMEIAKAMRALGWRSRLQRLDADTQRKCGLVVSDPPTNKPVRVWVSDASCNNPDAP